MTRHDSIDFDALFSTGAQVELVTVNEAEADGTVAVDNKIIPIEFCTRKARIILGLIITCAVAALVTLGIFAFRSK